MPVGRSGENGRREVDGTLRGRLSSVTPSNSSRIQVGDVVKSLLDTDKTQKKGTGGRVCGPTKYYPGTIEVRSFVG